MGVDLAMWMNKPVIRHPIHLITGFFFFCRVPLAVATIMIEFSQRMNVIYEQFSAILAPIIMADESEKKAQ